MSKIISYIFTTPYILILFFISITLEAEVNWSDYYWEKATIIPTKFQSSYWLEFYFLPNNPRYGYAVGTERNASLSSPGVFAKTSDSGKTWIASRIDEKEVFHAESVMFIDTNIGYCSGPNGLYKTIDGGTTWKQIVKGNSGEGYWGHYAIGDNVWIADGSCQKYESTYKYGGQTMYRSTDGGANWKSTKIEEQNHITDFKMFDTKNGYAIGSGAIFMTSDGGANWKKMCNTQQIQWKNTTTNVNWHEDLNIYNKSILIPASAGCQGGADTSAGAALFSSDFGASWKVFKTKGSTFGTWLNNDSTGWVCGYNAEVYYTKNYGKDWTLFNCGIDNKKNMDDLWFINDSTGFVGGDGGIYRIVKKEDSIAIMGDTTICGQDTAMLKTDNKYEKYEWYKITDKGDTIIIGNKGKDITVKEAGTYIVKGIHTDCYYVYSKPFIVNKGANKPDVKITTYCFGDNIILNVKGSFGSYIFDPQIIPNVIQNDTQIILSDYSANIDKVGFVYGTDDCIDTLWFNITFNERIKPILKADGKLTFCDNIDRTIYIENADLFTNNIWYLGNKEIAKNTNSYKPTESGTYKVIASNGGICQDSSDTLSIKIVNNRDALQVIGIDSVLFVDSVHYGKQSYSKLKIYNTSDKEFVLNNVVFRYKFAFTAPLSQFPIKIQPNSTADIIIYYTPTNLKMQHDTLYIEDNCSTILIPLSGFCLENMDSSDASCDVEITISTRSITQKEIIKLGLPIPNPVDSKGKIHYKIITETNTNNIDNKNNEFNEFSFQLYNAIGTPIDVPYNIVNKENERYDNQEIQKGEINFDMKNLSNGVYFIRIIYGSGSKVFSIIKN